MIIPRPRELAVHGGSLLYHQDLLRQGPDDVSLGDEGYRLDVGRRGVELTAGGPAGRFYGMRTLAQLGPSLPAGTVEEVLRLTHKERPADGSTQGSTRTLAARLGIGKDAVAKIWADHNLKPWKVETFKVSNDPRFEETRRCRWPVPESAGARRGVLLRREDPVPGVGPYPAVAADGPRPGADDDP